jgi:hypothetical protein
MRRAIRMTGGGIERRQAHLVRIKAVTCLAQIE